MSVQTVDHFFNPSSKEFIHDPVPTLEKLSAEFPISRFDAWQAWLVTGHANIINVYWIQGFQLISIFGNMRLQKNPLKKWMLLKNS